MRIRADELAKVGVNSRHLARLYLNVASSPIFLIYFITVTLGLPSIIDGQSIDP